MGGKPARKRLRVVVGNESENALFVAEVGVCGMIAADVAFAAADDAGDELVAHFDGIARRVRLDVFAERDDLARALVSERYGNNPERIALPLVHVRTADAAALHLYENIVVPKGGNLKFLYLDVFRGGEHSHLRRLGEPCGRRALYGRAAVHFPENFPNDVLHLGRSNVHIVLLFTLLK